MIEKKEMKRKTKSDRERERDRNWKRELLKEILWQRQTQSER